MSGRRQHFEGAAAKIKLIAVVHKRHNLPGSGLVSPGFDPRTYQTRAWKIMAFMHDGDKFDLGGRTLEVLATPGHTPDSIALIDRANGLLFTGDTYYPAAIWLYRPETDMDAYV